MNRSHLLQIFPDNDEENQLTDSPTNIFRINCFVRNNWYHYFSPISQFSALNILIIKLQYLKYRRRLTTEVFLSHYSCERLFIFILIFKKAADTSILCIEEIDDKWLENP